jgi:hypothetical protein
VVAGKEDMVCIGVELQAICLSASQDACLILLLHVEVQQRYYSNTQKKQNIYKICCAASFKTNYKNKYIMGFAT